MQSRVPTLIAVVACATVLAACEGTFGTQEDEGMTDEPATVEETGTETGTETTTTTTGVDTGAGFQGHPLDDPASQLAQRTVYFDFDSSEIKPADRSIIEAHAEYLASHPGAQITLEGHADERGSREYNIGLGERRASAVRQLMTLLGSSGQQIRTVSYGEERPVAECHDENCWALNRRVEIIYRTR